MACKQEPYCKLRIAVKEDEMKSEGAVGIFRCQFCYHWQVIDRYMGICTAIQETTHRSACCTNWKGDAILTDEEREQETKKADGRGKKKPSPESKAKMSKARREFVERNRRE